MLNCSYAYPTDVQMFEAAGNVVQMVDGAAPFDAACFAHCAGTLAMFGLSKAFPDGCPVPLAGAKGATEAPAASKEDLADACRPLVTAKGATADAAFDWKGLLKIAVSILLQFLG